ncbi:MAG: TetR/AcrR family transcriptional regulator [Ornithinibacter sp.]
MAKGGKTARGRKTAARIVTAATRLFVENGYVQTTMAAVAEEAGVAVQTLYLAFGSKAAILAEVHDLSVVGANENVPALDQPWVADVRAEVDGPRALRLVMNNSLGISERVATVYATIQTAAADTEVADLLAKVRTERLRSMRELAAILATKSGFATDLADRAADILYALVSVELYQLLVVERHWTSEDWMAWAYDDAARCLFPNATATLEEAPFPQGIGNHSPRRSESVHDPAAG